VKLKSSRCWIRLALPAGMAALYFAAATYSAPENLRPYSVQMHLHGSMSEGAGSMRGANIQAKKIGLDVLWWTDHDWRMAYHTYAAGYDFEADDLSATRPVPYPPGTDRSVTEGQEMQVDLTPHPANAPVLEPVARISTAQASQGKKSLEIAATSSGKQLPDLGAAIPDAKDDGEGGGRGKRRPQAIGKYQGYFFTIDASRRRFKRSLASNVTVDISVWPDFDAAPDRMAAIRFDLSQQPPDLAQGQLFYVLTGSSEADLRKIEGPHRKFVKLDFQPRQWNHFTLKLTEDARRLELGGEDNALVEASFGVLTSGPRAHAFFDDYRITHQRQSEPLREEARRMAAALQKEFGTINYVSQELSYQAHLNPFGERVPMIDYIRHPAGLTPKETVDFVHANGGVCSLNHIFGTSRAPRGVDVDDPVSARRFEDKRLQDLISSRCFGVDILEVGYPVRVLPMTSFLRVWDALSNAGVYVMADGVSDTHTSNGGWFSGNNFVTWIWARSKAIPDLVDGLRRGAAYFGDPTKYKGELRLTTEDGHSMGQIVVGGQPRHQVSIGVTNLPAGAKIRTVTGGKDGADYTATGTFQQRVEVDTARPTFFRIEVYTAEGKPLVFSNPIYFAGAEAKDISAYKRTVCK
jgi:hypothetical protein